MNSITYPVTGNLGISSSNPKPHFVPAKNAGHSLNYGSRISYSKCGYVWSYAGKIVILFRHLMNAAARSTLVLSKAGKELPEQLKKVAAHTKLCSIGSVPFSLTDCKSALNRAFKSNRLNDKEGTALSMLSASTIACDAADSVITFINAALTAASLKPIEALSATGMPFAFAIACMGSVLRTIQAAKASGLYHEIKPIIAKQTQSANLLKAFLEEKIGICDEDIRLLKAISQDPQNPLVLQEIDNIKERKKAALLRAAPKEAVDELENLYALINQNASGQMTHQMVQDASKSLQKVQGLLTKKFRIEILGIIANFLIFSALVLLKKGAQGAEPFLLFATSFSIRITSLIYQDFGR